MANARAKRRDTDTGVASTGLCCVRDPGPNLFGSTPNPGMELAEAIMVVHGPAALEALLLPRGVD